MYVVRIRDRYIKELMFPVVKSIMTENVEDAQRFFDREYIEGKLKFYLPKETYQIIDIAKANMFDGIDYLAKKRISGHPQIETVDGETIPISKLMSDFANDWMKSSPKLSVDEILQEKFKKHFGNEWKKKFADFRLECDAYYVVIEIIKELLEK